MCICYVVRQQGIINSFLQKDLIAYPSQQQQHFFRY